MILGRAVYLDLPLVSSVWFQRQSREPECKNEVERRSFRNVGWPSYLELAINNNRVWRFAEAHRVAITVLQHYLELVLLIRFVPGDQAP